MISTVNVPAGTKRPIRSIADMEVGSTVVCTRSVGQAMKGKEYTITATSGTRVDLDAGNRKLSVKLEDFSECFERRLGQVVAESIRRGLTAKAISDGDKFNKGDVVTLTETGGTVYDFKDSRGRRGAVKHAELLVYFIYL